MRVRHIPLAATLALAGTLVLAAAPSHGVESAGAGAAPDDGECEMMKMSRKKEREPGRMRARMAEMHAAMHGPMLEPALPAKRVAALGLDPAQRERIAAIEKENRTRQWALLGDLREERMALAESLSAPEPDPATATARLRAAQDLEARLLEARLTARRDALAVLTPDQRSRLAAPLRRPEAGRPDREQAAKPMDSDQDGDDDKDDEDPHAGHH
jgi:Spy/CpxP family protein refolding chaperone